MPPDSHRCPPVLDAANDLRSPEGSGFARGRRPAGWLCAISFSLLALAIPTVLKAEISETEIPQAPAEYAVSLRADAAARWKQGEYDVWRMRGNVRIEQGALRYAGDEALVKILRGDASQGEANLLIVSLEGKVEIVFPGPGASSSSEATYNRLVDSRWVGRLRSYQEPDVDVMRMEEPPPEKPGIYARLEDELSATYEEIQQAQAVEPLVPAGTAGSTLPPGVTPEFLPVPTPQGPAAGIRRLELQPRSPNARVQFSSEPSADKREQITFIPSGVRLIIEGTPSERTPFVGERLIVEADRVVIWTRADEASPVGAMEFSADSPIEFYLEGNVVFREGDRIIYADRMYYDVRSKKGAVLQAEMLTPAPGFQGLVRLKAEVLEQLDEQRLVARNGAVTSSRIGYPRYWVQGDTIAFTDVQSPVVDTITGAPVVDPATGEPLVSHEYVAESRDNFVFVGGVPVLYWPVLQTSLDEPSFYIESIKIENDSVFGFQTQFEFDAWQVFGISEPPIEADWDLSLDVMSKRGIGVGTDLEYEGYGLLGFPGPYFGKWDLWGIYDVGHDNLGFDRRDLIPDTELRGRARGQHRQDLGNGFQFTGELGLMSDGNFLEQYYEREFDQEKNVENTVELKQYLDTSSWRIAASVRTSDWLTQTNELPRFDHFVIGESLLFDRLTWYGHTHAGYYQLETAGPPSQNPEDLATYQPLPWEIETEGVRAGTRQELDLPLDVGPFRFTPYVLGDATFYGNDVTGEEETRLLGQTGVRGSIPFWTVDRSVQSELLNLNGLAHKILLESEFLIADSSVGYTELPMYDNLDDDTGEFLKRRSQFTTFAGSIPFQFDERSYAFRSAMQKYVAAPGMEIADDLVILRSAVRQRWQTKRGFPGQEQIIDWITFDVEGTYFANPDRDNFGEDFGQLNYDFRWALGDRVTILSDGYADTFEQGLRTASLGTQITRPEQGSLFVGMRSIDGPFEAYVLSSSLSYRMSQKWIATAGVWYDFGPTGSIGQNVGFTRIGESFLMRFGLDVDVSQGNVGLSLAIEPRFLPRSRLGNVAGVQIPALGERGLE